ncbi:GNAT family N-acetyltransferase [Paractinoplanes globisporus]|uniref:GNAT family N-acetyltransferase n=1 Tax=Paractinoplanes globisporus TaxID=113565 RepID=A0ABW6WCG7_9ACTN|nr:GNAT family protein [Actinoplanes globisporus]
MLRGSKVGLRARYTTDIEILQAELYDDVVTRSRADSRAWRPLSPDSSASPYRIAEPTDDAACFSVIELDPENLAGEALLWGIDLHNRKAHLGISLRPAFRGRGLGADVVRVLCHYGFVVLGLQRLQIETLSDNAAMIASATKNGFKREGVIRRSAWVTGAFADELLMGLLADEWSSNGAESAT